MRVRVRVTMDEQKAVSGRTCVLPPQAAFKKV